MGKSADVKRVEVYKYVESQTIAEEVHKCSPLVYLMDASVSISRSCLGQKNFAKDNK